MAGGNQINPQPNLYAMADVHRRVADEIVLFANVPQFDPGQQILAAIGALHEEVRMLRRDITSQFRVRYILMRYLDCNVT
jgi:hypothetical protein